jgi:hypothetical protein
MKKAIYLLFLGIFFFPSVGNAQCIDPTLINPNAICPMIWMPVCGCDGNTYANECEATNFGGVTSWTDGECPVDTSQIDCIDPTLINPDAACITVWMPVCGCDGNTYGNDCEAINFGGVTSWTDGECPVDTSQIECMTIPSGVTFGLCDMYMGIANTDSGCVSISGCGSIGSDGIDYAGYFYGSTWECASACMEDTVVVLPCYNDSLINWAVDCVADYEPVCGCDDHTYWNACEAEYHFGVTSWMVGPCHAFCTPIPAGVTFGECAMPLGVAQTAEGCVYLSGCSSIGSDGMDYSGYFYDWMEECQAACGSSGIEAAAPIQLILSNPVQNELRVSSQVNQITLYNSLGENVLTSNTTTTNVGHLSNGLYLVKITGKGISTVQRIIVQH